MPSLTEARLLPPLGRDVSCAFARSAKESWIIASMIQAVNSFFMSEWFKINEQKVTYPFVARMKPHAANRRYACVLPRYLIVTAIIKQWLLSVLSSLQLRVVS